MSRVGAMQYRASVCDAISRIFGRVPIAVLGFLSRNRCKGKQTLFPFIANQNTSGTSEQIGRHPRQSNFLITTDTWRLGACRPPDECASGAFLSTKVTIYKRFLTCAQHACCCIHDAYAGERLGEP